MVAQQGQWWQQENHKALTGGGSCAVRCCCQTLSKAPPALRICPAAMHAGRTATGQKPPLFFCICPALTKHRCAMHTTCSPERLQLRKHHALWPPPRVRLSWQLHRGRLAGYAPQEPGLADVRLRPVIGRGRAHAAPGHWLAPCRVWHLVRCKLRCPAVVPPLQKHVPALRSALH